MSDEVPIPVKIGYLVPEFPNQTHIIFWREITLLREMGIEVGSLMHRCREGFFGCALGTWELRARLWSGLSSLRGSLDLLGSFIHTARWGHTPAFAVVSFDTL